MNEQSQAFAQQYRAALAAHLATGEEAGLLGASELGRRALTEGIRIADLVNAHQDALSTLGSANERGNAFLRELLAPFDMACRAHREAIAELESLSYSISHDLRAPLRAIDGFGRALAEDCADQLSESGKGYLQRVRDATRKMALLIEGLLELSRVGRGELQPSRVDLAVLARRIFDRLRVNAPDRQVEVLIAEPLFADADSRLLGIVLEHLLGNAWKFTSRRAQARIELGLRDEGGDRIYFVRDDGAGFDMAYADKLFAPFQRLHSPGEFEGLGIGLAVVQRIVRRHGGWVRAEAQTDQGALVSFTLGQAVGG